MAEPAGLVLPPTALLGADLAALEVLPRRDCALQRKHDMVRKLCAGDLGQACV